MTNVLLASAGEDVRLWATPDLNLHSVKNGTNANVVYCSCSGNGQYVAYVHEEEGLNIANLQDESASVIQIPTACEQSNVVFNGTSRYLLSGGVDCVVNIWDIKSRTTKRTYKDHSNPVTFCLFNYNDNVIASSSDHGEVFLTNVQSAISTEPLHTADTQAIRGLSYSHFTRSLLATASDSGSICLWDTKAEKLMKTFSDHKAPATGLSFSPLNDMLLCSTGLDKRIIFYDVTGKKTVKTINTEGPVTCCDFMHDGCTVAVGTASGRLYLFDLRHGSTPIKVIPGHKTSVRSVSFQRTPKDNKSPRRPADESKASIATHVTLPRSRENSTIAEKEHNTMPPVQEHLTLSRESSSSSINQHESLMDKKSASATNLYNSHRENSTSNLLGGRENSTLALNRVLNLNKTPDMVPPKAAKLMGDDIFSPIVIDPALHSKKNSSRMKSSGKTNDIRLQSTSTEQDEIVRPGFLRSKSGGLSKFSLMTRSTDDLTRKNRDVDKTDKEDGGKKSGLLGFKSPFKKKVPLNYNKHSDESETSSIDSFGIAEDKFNTLGTRRGKKDRLSDRSTDSNGRPSLENNRYNIDTNQLINDIQNSLGTNSDSNKSPSIHSGDLPHSLRSNEIFQYGSSSTGGPDSGRHFQVDFIQRMIDEAMEENRTAVHSDMVNLQVEMLRQMEIQKEQIRQMMQHYSINDDLVSEIDRLRAENERLKAKY